MDKEKKVLSRTVRIPTASVKTLVATDYEIVAAPGTGKVIELLSALFTLDYKTATYVCPNTDHTLAIGGATFDSDAELQALLEATARYSTVVRPPAGSTPVTENQALVVAVGGTGECTTGDSDLVVEVRYMVHDVTTDV